MEAYLSRRLLTSHIIFFFYILIKVRHLSIVLPNIDIGTPPNSQPSMPLYPYLGLGKIVQFFLLDSDIMAAGSTGLPSKQNRSYVKISVVEFELSETFCLP